MLAQTLIVSKALNGKSLKRTMAGQNTFFSLADNTKQKHCNQ